MGPLVWAGLPAAMVLAGLVAWLAARLGPAAIGVAIAVATALLLPGIAVAVAPGLWPVAARQLVPGWLLAARMLGALPLLLLPVLRVLARMPPGQARAASGLGAGPAARLRLLWLPQLGPACLLGVALAGMLVLATLAGHGRAHPGAQALLSSPRPGP